MAKLLVTGHRGLLGSACIRVLRNKYEILTFNEDLIDPIKFRSWYVQNRPEYVIHCAARVGGVKANRDNPVRFLIDNLKIQTNVIESAFKYGANRLVFIGTSCLFPRNAQMPVSEESLLTGKFEPDVEAYAVAKLAGYEMCKAYKQQYGAHFTTACPSNLYGPGDNYGPSAHVIPALIKKISDSLLTSAPVNVWGNGSAVREFMYVDDAAEAIGIVLEKFDGDIINIGTGVGTSIRDVVYALIAIAGGGVEVKFDPSQPTGIPEKTFNIRKIVDLGWIPKTCLPQGLKTTWDEFRNNPNFRCQ